MRVTVEVRALRDWLRSFTALQMRAVERPQSVLHASGRRLHGVRILQNFWLGRNRKFYRRPTGALHVVEVPLEEVGQFASLLLIQLRWRAEQQRAAERRRHSTQDKKRVS